MSYILEALKKAQAERQIGSAPTIHAPTLAGAPTGQGRRNYRVPVLVAFGLMGAAIAGMAAMLLRQPAAPVNPPLAVPVAATPSAPVLAAPQEKPAVEVATVAPVPAPVDSPPQPQARTEPPVTSAPPAVQAPPVAAPVVQNVAAAPAIAPTPAPAPVAPAEEQYQFLRELPEPIQRAVPPIAMGGYMYSKNPADRLLLIDKSLRREGDEVAPGLVLEKLLPKFAVFSFRGYRYRVPL